MKLNRDKQTGSYQTPDGRFRVASLYSTLTGTQWSISDNHKIRDGVSYRDATVYVPTLAAAREYLANVYAKQA